MGKKVTLGILASAAVAMTLALPVGGADKAGEKITLKQHFAPGEYVETVSLSKDQQVTMAGETIKDQCTQTVVLCFTFGKPDADGAMQATMAYKRFQATTTQSGRATAYDSDRPADTLDSNMTKFFGPITKAKLDITIGSDDKVTDVKGVDELWEEMAKSVPDLEPMLFTMKKYFNGDAIKCVVEEIGKPFPAKPVGVGDEWTVDTTMSAPLVGPMHVKQKCVLKDIENTEMGKVAVITFVADTFPKESTTTKRDAERATFRKTDVVITGQLRANIANPMLQTVTYQIKTTSVGSIKNLNSEEPSDFEKVTTMNIDTKITKAP
jgi:hypothetical protein